MREIGAKAKKIFPRIPSQNDKSLDTPIDLRWYLICKTPIDGSFVKPREARQKSLGSNEEIPWLRELIYTIALHFLAKEELLFKEVGVTCDAPYWPASKSRFISEVTVGPCDNTGLLQFSSDQYRDDWTESLKSRYGLASMRSLGR